MTDDQPIKEGDRVTCSGLKATVIMVNRDHALLVFDNRKHTNVISLDLLTKEQPDGANDLQAK